MYLFKKPAVIYYAKITAGIFYYPFLLMNFLVSATI